MLVTLFDISAALAQECVPVPQRIDCHPDPAEADVSEKECLERGCNWCPTDAPGAPFCHVPSDYGYKMVGQPEQTPTGYQVTLNRSTNASYFGNDAQTLTAEFQIQSDYRLRIKVRMYKNGVSR